MQYTALTVGTTVSNGFLWDFLESLTVLGEKPVDIYTILDPEYIGILTENDHDVYLRYDGVVFASSYLDETTDTLVNSIFPAYSQKSGAMMYEYLKCLSFDGAVVQQLTWSDALYQWGINDSLYHLGDGGTIWYFDY